MKVKGSITIYLSMLLISVMLLVNVIGESARISAVQAADKKLYIYECRVSTGRIWKTGL